MSVAVEALASALAYDRGAVAAGEWWRLATGLAAHWTTAHLVANVIAITVLAFAIARREGLAVFFQVLAVALLGQIAALAWLSDATQYRGSSGIAWALATYVAVRCARGRFAFQAAIGGVALLLSSLGADTASLVLPLGVLRDSAMHAAGAIAGLFCAIPLGSKRRSARARESQHQLVGALHERGRVLQLAALGQQRLVE